LCGVAITENFVNFDEFASGIGCTSESYALELIADNYDSMRDESARVVEDVTPKSAISQMNYIKTDNQVISFNINKIKAIIDEQRKTNALQKVAGNNGQKEVIVG
jgi:recombinational DNA repair protein RecR